MRDPLKIGMLLMLMCAGCQTAAPVKVQENSTEEMEKTLGAVAGAVTGKKLSVEDVKNLEKQLKTNKEARSAVESITHSLEGRPNKIKYCPLTGKRYGSNMTICPEHGEELKMLDE